MESFIKTEIHYNTIINKIKIDNGSDFKDFTLVETNKNLQETGKKLTIQLCKDDGISLEINGCSLFQKEIELLKEFLNQ